MHNDGYLNEQNIASMLNNKRFKDLNGTWQYYLTRMFGYIRPRQKIYSDRVIRLIKPDISIKVGKVVRYISIKGSQSELFHTENIFEFCKYLKRIGITNRTINTILLFHFGDGTNNGTGKDRMEGYEITRLLGDRVKEANAELNNHDVIAQIAERIMFRGVDDTAYRVDYIFNGETDYGLIVSRNQLIKYFYSKSFDFIRNLHIGPFMFRPCARYPHGKPIYSQVRREKITFEWPHAFRDLHYIYKHYQF